MTTTTITEAAVSKRKKHLTVRYRAKVGGVAITERFFAGRWRMYLDGQPYHNCALPERKRGQITDAQCPQCKHCYASRIITPSAAPCNECQTEHIADLAMRLQEQGIELGWPMGEMMHEYAREQFLKQYDRFRSRRVSR
jgi:hypothetical protein